MKVIFKTKIEHQGSGACYRADKLLYWGMNGMAILSLASFIGVPIVRYSKSVIMRLKQASSKQLQIMDKDKNT
jgi:hypothetical protein